MHRVTNSKTSTMCVRVRTIFQYDRVLNQQYSMISYLEVDDEVAFVSRKQKAACSGIPDKENVLSGKTFHKGNTRNPLGSIDINAVAAKTHITSPTKINKVPCHPPTQNQDETSVETLQNTEKEELKSNNNNINDGNNNSNKMFALQRVFVSPLGNEHLASNLFHMSSYDDNEENINDMEDDDGDNENNDDCEFPISTNRIIPHFENTNNCNTNNTSTPSKVQIYSSYTDNKEVEVEVNFEDVIGDITLLSPPTTTTPPSHVKQQEGVWGIESVTTTPLSLSSSCYHHNNNNNNNTNNNNVTPPNSRHNDTHSGSGSDSSIDSYEHKYLIQLQHDILQYQYDSPMSSNTSSTTTNDSNIDCMSNNININNNNNSSSSKYTVDSESVVCTPSPSQSTLPLPSLTLPTVDQKEKDGHGEYDNDNNEGNDELLQLNQFYNTSDVDVDTFTVQHQQYQTQEHINHNTSRSSIDANDVYHISPALQYGEVTVNEEEEEEEVVKNEEEEVAVNEEEEEVVKNEGVVVVVPLVVEEEENLPQQGEEDNQLHQRQRQDITEPVVAVVVPLHVPVVVLSDVEIQQYDDEDEIVTDKIDGVPDIKSDESALVAQEGNQQPVGQVSDIVPHHHHHIEYVEQSDMSNTGNDNIHEDEVAEVIKEVVSESVVKEEIGAETETGTVREEVVNEEENRQLAVLTVMDSEIESSVPQSLPISLSDNSNNNTSINSEIPPPLLPPSSTPLLLSYLLPSDTTTTTSLSVTPTSTSSDNLMDHCDDVQGHSQQQQPCSPSIITNNITLASSSSSITPELVDHVHNSNSSIVVDVSMEPEVGCGGGYGSVNGSGGEGSVIQKECEKGNDSGMSLEGLHPIQSISTSTTMTMRTEDNVDNIDIDTVIAELEEIGSATSSANSNSCVRKVQFSPLLSPKQHQQRRVSFGPSPISLSSSPSLSSSTSASNVVCTTPKQPSESQQYQYLNNNDIINDNNDNDSDSDCDNNNNTNISTSTIRIPSAMKSGGSRPRLGPNARRPSILPSRRVSVGLALRSQYDETKHMPRHSAAELEAAVEDAVHTVTEKLKYEYQLKEKCMAGRIEELEESAAGLQLELAETRSQVLSQGPLLTAQKTQITALSRHIQTLESELSVTKQQLLETEVTVKKQRENDLQEYRLKVNRAVGDAVQNTKNELENQFHIISSTYEMTKQTLENEIKTGKMREYQLLQEQDIAVEAARQKVFDKAKEKVDQCLLKYNTLKIQLGSVRTELEQKNTLLLESIRREETLSEELVVERNVVTDLRKHDMAVTRLLMRLLVVTGVHIENGSVLTGGVGGGAGSGRLSVGGAGIGISSNTNATTTMNDGVLLLPPGTETELVEMAIVKIERLRRDLSDAMDDVASARATTSRMQIQCDDTNTLLEDMRMEVCNKSRELVLMDEKCRVLETERLAAVKECEDISTALALLSVQSTGSYTSGIGCKTAAIPSNTPLDHESSSLSSSSTYPVEVDMLLKLKSEYEKLKVVNDRLSLDLNTQREANVELLSMLKEMTSLSV
eukprot:gene8615-17777_t